MSHCESYESSHSKWFRFRRVAHLAAELARDEPDDGAAEDAADAKCGHDDGPQQGGLRQEWLQERLGQFGHSEVRLVSN